MAATERALNTFELLEKILVLLPMVAVLRHQRVSRFWLACIKESPALQRKLFLMAALPLPAQAPRRQTFSPYATQPVIVNPLLYHTFCIRNSEISGTCISIRPAPGMHRLKHKYICENVLKRLPSGEQLDDLVTRPILQENENFYRYAGWTAKPRKDPVWCEEQLVAQQEKRHGGPNGVHYYIESWADMLLTQPPVKAISIRDTQRGMDKGAVRVIAADGVGVKLGDLVRAAADFYRSCCLFRGFKVDAEMEIFQSLETATAAKQQSTPFAYMTAAGRLFVDRNEELRFLRAWKVKLKCNLA